MFKLSGQEVSQRVIENIKSGYYITSHARERLQTRTGFVVYNDNGGIVFSRTCDNINSALDKRILAYYNTDGSINVAINEWDYFVFIYNEIHNNYTMITFKEKSHNDINIFEKQKLALKGIGRR